MSKEFAPLKRMAAIHDISGFGKCSLTVALPIVSATGVECACIPTALLSTHTGGFKNWTFRDLSSEIVPIAEHWKSLNLKFDSVYSGYLASEEQGALLEKTLELIAGEETLIIVDPAMADNGKYYSNFDDKMAECFRKIISRADVITPNITEACFLTHTEYRSGGHDEAYINCLLDRLSDFGPGIVAITGVSMEQGSVGIVARDNRSGNTSAVMSSLRDGTFHGTGDVFASAFAALLTRGAAPEDALKLAESLVAESVERTSKRNTPKHYGLDFESALPEYIRKTAEIFE